MTLADYQVEIGGVVLGPGTPYLIHDYKGLGIGEVRSGDVARPQRDGDHYGLDTRAGRVVTLKMTIIGDTPADAMQNFDTLAGQWWLRDGENERMLRFKVPGRAEQVVKGRPRRLPADMSRLLSRRIVVTAEFKSAHAPVFSADTTTGNALLPPLPGGRSYPRVYPLVYGDGSAGTGSLYVVNDGNYPTTPSLRINGPCSNPVVEQVALGRFLRFDIVLAATDYLDVDFEYRSVLLNGTTNKRSVLSNDSRWWDFDPGTTEVRFRADVYEENAVAAFTWRSAWVT